MVLSSACLVRLLATALLLGGPIGASKVICVSPNGHQALEDSVAVCCAPGDDLADTVQSEETPCQGCTDYPVSPNLEIRNSRSNSAHISGDGNGTDVVIGPAASIEAITVFPGANCNHPVSAFTSHPPAASLRC